MILSLAASFVANSLREDPVGFLTKVSERLRQAGLPGITWIPGLIAGDPTHRQFSYGELTRVRTLIEGNPAGRRWRDRALLRRIDQQLAELHAGPPAPRPVPSASGDRVLHLLTNSLPHTTSGYTQRSHEVLRAQHRAGIRSEAVTRLGYPVVVGRRPHGKVEVVDGVTYHRLLPAWFPGDILKRHERAVDLLSELVQQRDVGVIHTTTNFLNALVAARVARRCGIPWVYEVRGELERTWLSRLPQEVQVAAQESEFFQLARRQETEYARDADAVVALSEISRAQLIQRGVAAERIHVIPNSIDAGLLQQQPDKVQIRRELGLPEGGVLVGSVTSIVDYEGLDTLIRALEYLPQDHSALIVGEGTARPRLEALTRSLGLSDRVIFAGRQEPSEIWRWYSVLDVFVVPRTDTPVCRAVTPLKALSAQALGIPVIASDLPALREVTGGVAAYISGDDPRVWASAIVGAPDGGPGRTWAAERTWDAAARRYSELYHSLGLAHRS